MKFESVDAQIEDRNRRSQEYLESRGPVGRAMGDAGLEMANATDRIADKVNSRRGSYIRGFALGAMRGATLGAIAWVGAVCFTSLIVPGAGLAMFGLFAGAGALMFGLYHAGDVSERHIRHEGKKKKLADRISELTGGTLDYNMTEPLREGPYPPPQEETNHAARENERRNQQQDHKRGH